MTYTASDCQVLLQHMLCYSGPISAALRTSRIVTMSVKMICDIA